MTENTPTSSSAIGEATVGTLNASQLAVVMNADKSILRSIGSICFRRCIPSYEKEHLNEAEMVCVDRCTYKYDQMLKHVVENNPALRVWQNGQTDTTWGEGDFKGYCDMFVLRSIFVNKSN